MGTALSRIVALLMVAATGAGCGSDGGSGPGKSVLTTVEVTPATATLFTVAPGNAVTLAVVAKDQNGQTMIGTPTFSSDNGAIADVSVGGTVTALAAGTARITASVTIDGVTKPGTNTVTARLAPANAAVVAPAIAYQPGNVDVRAGGTVTWSFASIDHDVTFTTPGAPVSVAKFQNGSASRSFPTHGTFQYHCSLHASMTGTIYVH